MNLTFLKAACAASALFVASLSAFAGTVTLSSPVNGTTVSAPISVIASASSSASITGMKVYLDGKSAYSTSSGSISTSITATSGSHSITVKGWDSNGGVFSKSVTVTVGAGTSTAVPSSSTVYSNIEQMSGWGSCTGCAGAGGDAIYSMVQNQSSPSLDGNSTEFKLAGTTPFSHGLWWRRMSSSGTVSHFIFDMYYRIDKPANSQGLEFAANQQLSSGWYKFSTQCSWGGNQWRVWNSKDGGWVNTGIACTRPPANTWQHVVFEYQRSGGKAVFVSITVNGVKHYVGKSFYPQAKTGSTSVGIHFQLNGNSTQQDYNVWADKMTLTTW